MALPQVSNPKISDPWKIQILWFAGVVLLWIGFLFFSPLDLDYSSGELWDHFLAWRDGNPLYPSVALSPYRVLNYPPLFFGPASLLAQIGLSPLFAGRLLNSLAFFLSLWILFCWLRRKSLSSWQALAILSLSATSLPILYSTGQFHLEMLAVFLSLLGLFLLESPKGSSLILSAICLSLACLAKQTQVLSALIAFFWLLRYQPKKGLILGALLVVFGGLSAVLLTSWFTPEIWRHLILYTVGTYSLSELIRQWTYHLLPWLLLFLFGLRLGIKDKEKRRELSWWYFSGTTLGLLSTARIGSGSQYFIEWSFATLLWIGPSLFEIFSKTSPEKDRKWALWILVQILAADVVVGGVLLFDLKTLQNKNSLLPTICSQVDPGAKTVVAEDVGILRACGVEPALHPFIMTNLAERGLWNEASFLQQITSRNYPLILLPFDPRKDRRGVHAERWTENMIRTILENYRITKTIGDWSVLKPIGPSN